MDKALPSVWRIHLKIHAGEWIGNAVDDAMALSKTTGKPVFFTFNDKELEIMPEFTRQQIMDQYL